MTVKSALDNPVLFSEFMRKDGTPCTSPQEYFDSLDFPSAQEICQASLDEMLMALELYNAVRTPRSIHSAIRHLDAAWTFLLMAYRRRDGLEIRLSPAGNPEWKKSPRLVGVRDLYDIRDATKTLFPVSKMSHGEISNLDLIVELRNATAHSPVNDTNPLAYALAPFLRANLKNYRRLYTNLARTLAKFDAHPEVLSHLRLPLFEQEMTTGYSPVNPFGSDLDARLDKILQKVQSNWHEWDEEERLAFRLDVQLVSGANLSKKWEALDGTSNTDSVYLYAPGEITQLLKEKYPHLKPGMKHIQAVWMKRGYRVPGRATTHSEEQQKLANLEYCKWIRGNYYYTEKFKDMMIEIFSDPTLFESDTGMKYPVRSISKNEEEDEDPFF